MFILDQALTTSVTDGTAMLNNEADSLDWNDDGRGMPVFIYSSRKAEWYKCECDGSTYKPTKCWPADVPPLEAITLRKKIQYQSTSSSSSSSSTMPLTSASAETMQHSLQVDIATANTIVGKFVENKRLLMVQTWVSLYLQFPGFVVSPWKIADGQKCILYMEGPSLRSFNEQHLPGITFTGKLAKFGLTADMIEMKERGHVHQYKILKKGVKHIYQGYDTQEALRTLALWMVQAKLFDENLLAEVGKMIPTKTIVAQMQHVTLDVTDFDHTLSLHHMTSTKDHVKTVKWVEEVLFGDGERVNLLRSWFAGRASNGDPLVIVSFGYTDEICHVLAVHDLLQYVSRVYARARTPMIVVEVWENPSRKLNAPMLPTGFVAGLYPNTAFNKADIVAMLHTALRPDLTLFNDDDQNNVQEVSMRGLSAVVTEPVGVVRRGMTNTQLTDMCSLYKNKSFTSRPGDNR